MSKQNAAWSIALAAAAETARHSPCAKSTRGAALWHDSNGSGASNTIITAHNGPPTPFICTGEHCAPHCARLAEHAERRAIFAARSNVSGWTMLHIKVDGDGHMVATGPPSCIDCARAILEAGILGLWLYQQGDLDPAWHWWSAAELLRASYQFHGIDTKQPPFLGDRVSITRGALTGHTGLVAYININGKVGVHCLDSATIEFPPEDLLVLHTIEKG